MLGIRYGKLRRHSKDILSWGRINRGFSSEINLPKQADVVVVGGGVLGCSTFYHLCKRGIKAILLENYKVTSGTTWHSPATLWFLRGNDVETILLQKTRNLLQNLEKETGVDSGWIPSGGLQIARTPERLEEYKRLQTLGHSFGIESHLISPNEAQKLSPVLNPNVMKGALWVPSDGYTEPTMYCSALVKGATTNDGVLYENTLVTNIQTEPTNNGKKVIGVETNRGTIKTNVLVNACGAWSQDISRLVGLDIPLVAMKHGYILTGTVPGIKGTPQIKDRDASTYFRPQGEAVLLGVFEHNPEFIKELPQDFSFGLYDFDKSFFESYINKHYELCPSFEAAGLKKDIYGFESFTPDQHPVVGEDPECVGLFHGSGLNSIGIQLSGGLGEQLAAWVDLGRPELPLHNYDIRRFSQVHRQDLAWISETSHATYAKSYNIKYPFGQSLAGRNHRIDAFHEALVASGAVMESALSWERPSYFIKERTAPVRRYDWGGNYEYILNQDKRYENEVKGDSTFGFSKHHDLIKEEALAARNNVAVFNMSSYTKMYLAGPDADQAANWLFTADVNKEPYSVVRTFSLNSKGGVEADVIVVPLVENASTLSGLVLSGKGYYIITETKAGHLTKCHIREQLEKKNFKSTVTEVTDRIGILSFQGPRSGELLQSITESPITDEELPYGMLKLIKINGHACSLMRTSSIGELGYKLHIPFASCVPVFHKVVDAGRGFELKNAGFRAFNSLSCEKGHHLINSDLRMDDNPVEAGLSRLCKEDGQYLGKQAVERAKQEGVKKQRVFFTLQDHVPLYGYETIWRDDVVDGFLRRGDFGFSLDCSIGIGYVQHPEGQLVDSKFLESGSYQIEAMNQKYPAKLFLNSPFDPTNQRVLGNYNV